jgi:hypothetical protein
MHFVNLVQSAVLMHRVLFSLLLFFSSGPDKCYRHGKDNKLIVWKLSEEDEASMSTVLPVDTPPEPRKQPWLLHILEVNTMNFCSFAQTDLPSNDESSEELLIAVPNTMSSETVRTLKPPPLFYNLTTKRSTSSTSPPAKESTTSPAHPPSKAA